MSDRTIRIDELIDPAEARSGLRGLERESLRVSPDGRIAQTPHPSALGSPLTHEKITTDFSEALLEFVTPPRTETTAVLAELTDLEAFAAQAMGDELLWMTSMPCFIDDPDTIPIGRYGRSNAGRMKYLYRMGLAARYGSAMQAIAGVHFNFSFPEALWEPLLAAREMPDGRSGRDALWMGLIRNVQRLGWALLYLFGASPASCPSFTRERPSWLGQLRNGSLAAPHGTSLRLSDIGYKNRSQAYLNVSTNSLKEWVADLSRALFTEEPAFAAIGVRNGEDWHQLSTGILQIENEYYGLIRPKSRPRLTERPTAALLRDGVRYVELRALDIDPQSPLGIAPGTMAFLETFLWYCLLEPSPPLTPSNQLEISYNQRNVAIRGREPGLQLRRNSGYQLLPEWGRSLVESLWPVAEHLDNGLDDHPHTQAVRQATACFEDPALTPSAKTLQEIRDTREGFLHWALGVSRRHTEALRECPLAQATRARLEATAHESLRRQADMEASDTEPFDVYLEHYYASGPRG